MSSPVVAPQQKKKTHRGRGHRNTAVCNPPKTQSTVSQLTRVSQASQLLAQLAAAQGNTALQSQPSTSKINAPKIKETNVKGNKMMSMRASVRSSINKASSVGARMSAKQAQESALTPPSSQRGRTVSQSVGKQMQPVASEAHRISGVEIPEDVLDSISFRFIMNIPDSERLDETRICFQIELAHWFYIDFYVNQEEREDCRNIGMRDFQKQMFAHNDFLKPFYHRSDEILDNWRLYKSTVPTYGGILLDSTLTHILLVQGFYSSKNKWGFPKGKVNENESPRDCAVREVREETGFDFGEHSIDGGEFKIQKMVNNVMIRLYVVKDVPVDFKFEPQTRCEIRTMKWFNIFDLPVDRNDQVAASKGFPAKNFFGVVPFIQDLQNYVKREEKRREKDSKAKQEKEKGVTLSNSKKNSAFTKVLKMSPSERSQLEASSTSAVGDTHRAVERHEPAGASDILFKPLGETGGAPPGSNLAVILAQSSSSWTTSKPASSKTPVAHPVAIRPCNQPVYEAGVKEERCKVASALIANMWPSSSADTSSSPSMAQGTSPMNALSATTHLTSHHSATQIEHALNKILFHEQQAALESPISNAPLRSTTHLYQRHQQQLQQRDSSVDGDEEVKECVPALSQESCLPPLSDAMITTWEGMYPTGALNLPSTSSRHSLSSVSYRRHSVTSSLLSPPIARNLCAFQLVPAWKCFKLNREVLMEEISRFM